MSVVIRRLTEVKEVKTMTATTAMSYPTAPSNAQRACPEGVDRAILQLGTWLTEWAQNRADRKAAVRRSSGLSALSDHERAQLYREVTTLRESAYAERAHWHVIG